MANTKISQLTSYTGTVRDIRWFVINNAAQSETFRYSGYTSQVIPGVGVNSFATFSGSAAGSTSIAFGVNASAIAEKDIAIGSGAVTSSGSQNTSIGTNTSAGGNNSVAIGVGSVASASSTVAIGRNSTASADSAVVLGNSNIASGANSFSVGEGNTASGNRATSFGWNNLASGGYSFAFGRLSQATGNGGVAGGNEARANAEGALAIGWTVNQITQGQGNTILGGDLNYISATNSKNNSLFGTSNSNITGTTGQYSAVLAGFGNNFGNIGSGTTIVGGQYNFGTTSSFSSLIGSTNSILSGRTRTIGLGLSGRTPDADTTTFVENLHVYRTPSTNVPSVVSGVTFTCNLNDGAKQQFYLTGVTTIDITNVRNGQSFLIKTQTDGGHTITWTATGYTFKFKGGSSNPGNNKIDLFRFEVFDTVIYGELISDFS
jgi:hypothetical protein